MNRICKVIRTRRERFSMDAKSFLCARMAGNEQLIVALVMIAISVALVLIFKDKISTLLTDFMTNVTSKINTALGS